MAKVAWSDDLSYDSEEEREKEKLAAAESADVETVEKPQYTEGELAALVGFVRSGARLCGANDRDFDAECVSTIASFVEDPRCAALSVYYEAEGKLRAALGVPSTAPSLDLAYFVREPDAIFTVENFHDEVAFGTVVESVEACLLATIDRVYAPLFAAADCWPKNIKEEFFTQLQTFLSKLTDKYYRTLGLTILYVPCDDASSIAERTTNNRELVKRSENVVVYWLQQINTCLRDDALIINENELPTPSDELEFWIYRYENLNAVRYQIRNPKVVQISNVLVNAQSSYIKQFEFSNRNLDECIEEAKSNIEFLQIITPYCTIMRNETDLESLPKHIADIINVFRFIWTESPYYNTVEKITNMCKYLSNQVIIQCSKSIDLTSLFNGNTMKAIEQLSKCIQCCKAYKEIYDSVCGAHSFNGAGKWELNDQLIFAYVDSFTQRCVDLLEICNGMIIFGKIDETTEKVVPQFGGTEGKSYEDICERIETLFKRAISKVHQVKEEIFDVHATSWYERMLEFRSITKYIEELIKNLLSSIFSTINNIEEGIEILSSTCIYSKRQNLHKFFVEITAKVWNLFAREIESVKKDMVTERDCLPDCMPNYSGQAIMLHTQKKYLMYLNMIMDSTIWMLPCDNSKDIKKWYQELMLTIDSTINKIWTSWTNTLDNNLNTGLERPPISNSYLGIDLLECNFDRNLIFFLKEIVNWENIGYEVPANFNKIYSTMNETKIIYESTLLTVKQYNKIQEMLSEEEKSLFKPLISSERPPNDETLSTLRTRLTAYAACARHAKRDIEATNFAAALQRLTAVYDGIERDLDTVLKPWLEYVARFDALLDAALVADARMRLRELAVELAGNGAIRIAGRLDGGEIRLDPTPRRVRDAFAAAVEGALSPLRDPPTLRRALGVPDAECVRDDALCRRLAATIRDESERALGAIDEAVDAWNARRRAWTIPRREFVLEYASRKPTASELERDVARYSHLADEIRAERAVSQAKYVVFECGELRSSAIRECVEWQRELRSVRHDEVAVGRRNVLGELRIALDDYDDRCARFLSPNDG